MKFSIFSYLPTKDVLNFSETNKENHQFVQRDEFWRYKIKNEFFTDIDFKANAKEVYKKLFNETNSELSFYFYTLYTVKYKILTLFDLLFNNDRTRCFEYLLMLLPREHCYSFIKNTFPLDEQAHQFIYAEQLTHKMNYQQILTRLHCDKEASILNYMNDMVKLGLDMMFKIIFSLSDHTNEELSGEARSKSLSATLLTAISYQRIDVIQTLIRAHANVNSLSFFTFHPQTGKHQKSENLTLSPLAATIIQLRKKLNLRYNELNGSFMNSMHVYPSWRAKVEKCSFLQNSKEIITLLLNAGANPHLEEPNNGLINRLYDGKFTTAYQLAQNFNHFIAEDNLNLSETTKNEVSDILNMILNIPKLNHDKQHRSLRF